LKGHAVTHILGILARFCILLVAPSHTGNAFFCAIVFVGLVQVSATSEREPRFFLVSCCLAFALAVTHIFVNPNVSQNRFIYILLVLNYNPYILYIDAFLFEGCLVCIDVVVAPFFAILLKSLTIVLAFTSDEKGFIIFSTGNHNFFLIRFDLIIFDVFFCHSNLAITVSIVSFLSTINVSADAFSQGVSDAPNKAFL
jgi:hypothetical protein